MRRTSSRAGKASGVGWVTSRKAVAWSNPSPTVPLTNAREKLPSNCVSPRNATRSGIGSRGTSIAAPGRSAWCMAIRRAISQTSALGGVRAPTTPRDDRRSGTAVSVKNREKPPPPGIAILERPRKASYTTVLLMVGHWQRKSGGSSSTRARTSSGALTVARQGDRVHVMVGCQQREQQHVFLPRAALTRDEHDRIAVGRPRGVMDPDFTGVEEGFDDSGLLQRCGVGHLHGCKTLTRPDRFTGPSELKGRPFGGPPLANCAVGWSVAALSPVAVTTVGVRGL